MVVQVIEGPWPVLNMTGRRVRACSIHSSEVSNLVYPKRHFDRKLKSKRSQVEHGRRSECEKLVLLTRRLKTRWRSKRLSRCVTPVTRRVSLSFELWQGPRPRAREHSREGLRIAASYPPRIRHGLATLLPQLKAC